MISFSFALVIATYRTRSSSPSISDIICQAKIFFFSVVPRSFSTGSAASAAMPNLWSASTGAEVSLVLNLWSISARITTGNSSPLDLCMVMILTELPWSEAVWASPKSVSYFFSSSI